MSATVVAFRPAGEAENQTARQALLDVLCMLDENPDLKTVIVYEYPDENDQGSWSGFRYGGPDGPLGLNERIGMLAFAQHQVFAHATE